MKDIKVPGVVWAIAIVLVTALIHYSEPWIVLNTPFNAITVDVVVVALIGILKRGTLGLETKDLNTALDIIDSLLVSGGPRPRGSEGASLPIDIPERPNPTQRWLLG